MQISDFTHSSTALGRLLEKNIIGERERANLSRSTGTIYISISRVLLPNKRNLHVFLQCYLTCRNVLRISKYTMNEILHHSARQQAAQRFPLQVIMRLQAVNAFVQAVNAFVQAVKRSCVGKRCIVAALRLSSVGSLPLAKNALHCTSN